MRMPDRTFLILVLVTRQANRTMRRHFMSRLLTISLEFPLRFSLVSTPRKWHDFRRNAFDKTVCLDFLYNFVWKVFILNRTENFSET
jgi:hypothetical protein